MVMSSQGCEAELPRRHEVFEGGMLTARVDHAELPDGEVRQLFLADLVHSFGEHAGLSHVEQVEELRAVARLLQEAAEEF